MTTYRSRSSSIIRASEIGQYRFCSIAWKLQKMGYVPNSPALKRGVKAHQSLGYQLESFDRTSHISQVLLKVSIVVFAIGVLGIVGWLLL